MKEIDAAPKQTKQVVENFDELKQEPVLQDIEQYRMQMAGICTAALGYWKEGDSIHPDYDTPALREVARLYAKYNELYKANRAPEAKQEPDDCIRGDWGNTLEVIEAAIAAAEKEMK